MRRFIKWRTRGAWSIKPFYTIIRRLNGLLWRSRPLYSVNNWKATFWAPNTRQCLLQRTVAVFWGPRCDATYSSSVLSCKIDASVCFISSSVSSTNSKSHPPIQRAIHQLKGTNPQSHTHSKPKPIRPSIHIVLHIHTVKWIHIHTVLVLPIINKPKNTHSKAMHPYTQYDAQIKYNSGSIDNVTKTCFTILFPAPYNSNQTQCVGITMLTQLITIQRAVTSGLIEGKSPFLGFQLVLRGSSRKK